MFNLEGELPRRSFAVNLLKVTGGLVAAATSAPIWLPPRVARAEEWLGASVMPVQPREFFPLSQEGAAAFGMHTVYESDGSLDSYDKDSADIGTPTNFCQKGRSLAEWYFDTYSGLDRIHKLTTGFCHGVANALAYGENLDPYNYIKLGQQAAVHSGDSMYKPGLEQLMEDLATQEIPFIIETDGPEGYWTRVVYQINAERTLLKTTDFGRRARIMGLDQVQNYYYPVPQGEEGNYPAGTVQPVLSSPEMLERWTFNLDRIRVRS